MDLVHTPNVEKDFASAAVSGKNQEAKSFSGKKKWTRHVCLRVVEKDFADPLFFILKIWYDDTNLILKKEGTI